MSWRSTVASFDAWLIKLMNICTFPMARIALFVVFFWFGALKVFYISPANPLVEALLQETLPFITFAQFIVLFGIFEMIIGALFLVPLLTRAAIALLGLHMFTTFMPLLLLPETSWDAPFVPTLEGQYIIKNLVIIALAMSIVAHLDPMTPHHHKKTKQLRRS